MYQLGFRKNHTVRIAVAAGIFGTLLTTVVSRGIQARVSGSPGIAAERTIEENDDAIMDLAFLPDGKRLISGSHDKTVCLWDLSSGKKLHVFHGPRMGVHDVAVSPDGKRVAAGTIDHTGYVWNIDTGELIAVLHGKSRTMHVKFLPDGHLLSGCGDGILRIWDVDLEKELWHSAADECVTALAISADGRRGAYGACDGIVRVWDLVEHRLLGKFGEFKEHAADAVIFTPDGKKIYRNVWGDGVRGWNIDTGEMLPMPKRVANAADPSITQGALRVVDMQGEVIDLQTGEIPYKVQKAGILQTRAYVFSPDRSRLAIGGGGWGYDDEPSWESRHDNNIIRVFPIPGSTSANGPGPHGADSVSWELLPAQVRTGEGKLVPVTDLEGRPYWQGRTPWKCLSLRVERDGKPDQPLDVLVSSIAVLLQKEPGILDAVLTDPAAGYSDVAWDGRHLWIASSNKGISVLDTSGQVVEKIDDANGLPAATKALRLYALAEGKILAAGADVKAGWCAMLDAAATPEGKTKTSVKAFYHADEIGGRWSGGVAPPGSPLPLFLPMSITEPPAAANSSGSRTIWVICDRIPRSVAPIVRIDVSTLACTSYNLNDLKAPPPTFEHPGWLFFKPESIAWIDNKNLIASAGGKLMKVKVGVERMERAEARTLATVDPNDPDFLNPIPINGQLYYPGNCWYRLDTKTNDVRRVGTGVCVEGQPINGSMTTFVSGLLGLVGFSPEDGGFFRISVDPARPLSIRPPLARLELPKEPPDGLFYGENNNGQFRCAGGELIFSQGKLVPPDPFDRSIHQSVWAKQLEKGMSRFVLDSITMRMFDPDERARAGISDAQFQKFKQLLEETQRTAPIQLDSAKLEAMFQTFRPAIGTPRVHTAAKPLMEEARKVGQRWSEDCDRYLTQFRAIFSDRQLKLLTYEDPDAPGEPDLWSH